MLRGSSGRGARRIGKKSYSPPSPGLPGSQRAFARVSGIFGVIPRYHIVLVGPCRAAVSLLSRQAPVLDCQSASHWCGDAWPIVPDTALKIGTYHEHSRVGIAEKASPPLHYRNGAWEPRG